MGYLQLAQLQLLRGDKAGSLTWLKKAQASAQRSRISWLISRVNAQRAHLALRQGDFGAAARWAQASELGKRDALGYRREGEYAVLARVRLAEGKLPEALELLDWLLEVTSEAGLVRGVIEASLLKALSLAEPEGYLRLFVDEGEAVVGLLQQAARRGRLLGHINTSLEAFEVDERAPATASVDETSLPLDIDSLSERELEVLRLVAVGLSNKQVARQLGVAPGTVKKHLHNINGKLGVKRRTEAVARARELGLLQDR